MSTTKKIHGWLCIHCREVHSLQTYPASYSFHHLRLRASFAQTFSSVITQTTFWERRGKIERRIIWKSTDCFWHELSSAHSLVREIQERILEAVSVCSSSRPTPSPSSQGLIGCIALPFFLNSEKISPVPKITFSVSCCHVAFILLIGIRLHRFLGISLLTRIKNSTRQQNIQFSVQEFWLLSAYSVLASAGLLNKACSHDNRENDT